jgi:flagellar P-ring protein precursor FlgI
MRTLITIALVGLLAGNAHADRIKDLATIGGVRENHLTGFGLVVGLDGSGDDTRSPMVRTGLTKMLKKLGVTIDPKDLKSKNVAAVMITAELPPFAKPGMALDIHVSSVGNAKSLSGGELLAAPLKGADARTYAIAQGSLSIGGFVAGGDSGSTTKKNHTLVGTVPGAAIVEAGAPTMLPTKQIALVLKDPDFTTATRMRDAIIAALGPNSARLGDGAVVVVPIPKEAEMQVGELITKLEAIEVDPDVKAKVIVDERTGTIVIGESVTLRTAAITYGGLTIEIGETPVVSQPGAFGRGDTKVVKQTDIKATEKDNTLRVINKSATVGDVVAALNAIGAKPRDLVAILRALKASGALRADLETM